MAKRKSRIKCLLITSAKEVDFFQTIFTEVSSIIKTEILIEPYTEADRNIIVHTRPREKDFLGAIISSDLIFVDLDRLLPAVYIEIGIARAIGKPIIFVSNERNLLFEDLPDFIRQSFFILYSKNEDLKKFITNFFDDYLKNPKRYASRPLIESELNSQIVVDIDKLAPREFENLCFELLSRLGYKQLEWKIKDDFIDAVSTLQKKDPDGFEYNEFWLISFEKEYKSKEMFDIALHDPQYFAERIFKYISEPGLFNSDRSIKSRTDVPVTLLFILKDKDNFPKRFIKELSQKDYRIRERGYPFTIRIRWWDEEIITSLVQNNTQLARKYFSPEGLEKSNIRLSYEELYKQNLGINEQLERTNKALLSEKNRVELLERDSAWKLLSFTAAHRLGNPIDAVDAELQNLKQAFLIGSSKEFIEDILTNMETSVEKAKSIVLQFRNLSIAHEIKPETVNSEKLNSILKNSAKHAVDKKIDVNFNLANVPDVSIDTQKLSECFEEIIRNALHFIKKENPHIIISTSLLKNTELPDKIDRTREYIKITFADNGCGVPIEKKNDIFKPFERSYVHGTGLGLAFCEAIIEKHLGKIREIGKPNEGALFEIFLPTIQTKEVKK